MVGELWPRVNSDLRTDGGCRETRTLCPCLSWVQNDVDIDRQPQRWRMSLWGGNGKAVIAEVLPHLLALRAGSSGTVCPKLRNGHRQLEAFDEVHHSVHSLLHCLCVGNPLRLARTLAHSKTVNEIITSKSTLSTRCVPHRNKYWSTDESTKPRHHDNNNNNNCL